MINYYPQMSLRKYLFKTKGLSQSKTLISLCLLFVLMIQNSVAQTQYTALEGTLETSMLGVSPFSIANKNQRTQYLYVGNLLIEQGAPAGFITALSVKITELPATLNSLPQNLQIKLGLTDETVLPATLVSDLPVYYSTAEENITQEGWYTFQLSQPFAWNGYSNIIMEFCRTNPVAGDSYFVEVHLGSVGEYRTVGLYNDNDNGNGCTLTGSTPISLANRRLLPSMKFTMTDPCSGTSNPGTMTVTPQDSYCNAPFTLGAVNDSQTSGLVYQWQSNLNNNAEFQDIPGATAATLTISQDYSTYYRRGVRCGTGEVMVFPPAIYVTSADCECYPTVSVNNNSGISQVNFGTIDNTSGTSSTYTDYSAIETIVNKLNTIPLTVNVTSTTDMLTTKAWVDWNKDGIYSVDESYELGTSAPGTNVSSGLVANVVVPATAQMGITKMRIRTAVLGSAEDLEACGNFQSGETEDYSVKVEEQLGTIDHANIANAIVAFGQAQSVKVRSTNDPLKSVKIFDMRGRLLVDRAVNSYMEYEVNMVTSANQILLVQIETASGVRVAKIVSIN